MSDEEKRERVKTEFGMGMCLGQARVIDGLPVFSRARDAIMAAAEKWRLHKMADSKDELMQEISIQLWLAAVEYQQMVSDEVPAAGDKP